MKFIYFTDKFTIKLAKNRLNINQNVLPNLKNYRIL